MYKGDTVVLASQSPRRKQLLEQARIPFSVQVADTDESFPDALPLADIPVHIARQKAAVIAAITSPEKIIIAADTVVVLDNTIIGKPRDREDAIRILTALSGREHKVITGVIIRNAAKEVAFSKETGVFFNPLTQEQITYYVDNYKPYDKAGAYAIQEWIGAVAIDKIEGCFYNVMGLPVSRVVEELEKF